MLELNKHLITMALKLRQESKKVAQQSGQSEQVQQGIVMRKIPVRKKSTLKPWIQPWADTFELYTRLRSDRAKPLLYS
jgi:hypothetical protein